MGSGQKLLTRVGSIFSSLGQIRSAIFGLGLGLDFENLHFGSKKISSGRAKKLKTREVKNIKCTHSKITGVATQAQIQLWKVFAHGFFIVVFWLSSFLKKLGFGPMVAWCDKIKWRRPQYGNPIRCGRGTSFPLKNCFVCNWGPTDTQSYKTRAYLLLWAKTFISWIQPPKFGLGTRSHNIYHLSVGKMEKTVVYIQICYPKRRENRVNEENVSIGKTLKKRIV